VQSQLQARLSQALQGVDGWLYLNEAWALHETVRTLPSPDVPATVVEIGSWKGRSTIALALGLMARGGGSLFAVDPHTGPPTGNTDDWNGATVTDGATVSEADFRRNITAAGVASVVRPLVTTSHEARSQFANSSVDFLFIDGNHEYDAVRTDILDWRTALKDGAIIAFNDLYAPGVSRALKELVIHPGSDYRNPVLIQNTLFAQLRPDTRWRGADSLALMRLRFAFGLRFVANPLRRYMPDWFVRAAQLLSTVLVGRHGLTSDRSGAQTVIDQGISTTKSDR